MLKTFDINLWQPHQGPNKVMCYFNSQKNKCIVTQSFSSNWTNHSLDLESLNPKLLKPHITQKHESNNYIYVEKLHDTSESLDLNRFLIHTKLCVTFILCLHCDATFFKKHRTGLLNDKQPWKNILVTHCDICHIQIKLTL